MAAPVVKIVIWNSLTSPETDNRARLEVPIDGQPHKIIDLVKSNSSKYEGKVVGNTILIKDFHGATLTMNMESGRAVQLVEGKDTKFGGDDQALDDEWNYDVSAWTITARAN